MGPVRGAAFRAIVLQALIEEYDGAGVLQHRTVHGPGVDEPPVWHPPTGRRFLDAGDTGRFQYTGQMWIPELALYHYKARVYHPRFGRFLQTDPIGYQDQMNLYAYVGNDPLNATDPT